MNAFPLLPLCAALLLGTACSQPGVRASQPAVLQSAQAAKPAPVAPAEAGQTAAGARAETDLPRQPLTPDLLFRFLVAEIAGQRSAVGIAQSTYLDLARQTRDPRVARRATEMAMFGRNPDGALEAARIWAETDPASERARQAVAALLINSGRLEEAEPLLHEQLERDTANGFLHLSALFGKVRDTRAVLGLVERLAAAHPTLPEAHFAVAQAAARAGRFEEAVASLKRADALRPGWEPAALMRAQVLARQSRADALAFMREFLLAHPGARDVRLAYARTLVNASQFSEAHAEFTRLTQEFPRNAEVSYAAGLLSLQMGDLDAARALLTQALEFNPREPDAVHYYLGQTEEQAKRPDEAARAYAKVGSGTYLVSARVRQAVLLARADRLDEGIALLAGTRGVNDAQNVRLVQAQAELLRDARRHVDEFAVLDEGLKRFPDSPDLLYDRALAAGRLDRLDVLEADLRRVISLRPDDAHAYNALGYTLADRTDRISEAIELLDRALALAPDDPYILDSVGWAQFRAGNLERAQEFLDRAFKLRPDPEIAAHLGEVLWVRGMREEASRLWQSSLQSHPDNEVLLETLRRLKP